MKSVVLILDTIHGLNVLVNSGRDECPGCWEEVREKTVDAECRSESPDVEHIVDVLCTANGSFQRGVHLCGPGEFLAFVFGNRVSELRGLTFQANSARQKLGTRRPHASLYQQHCSGNDHEHDIELEHQCASS